MRDTTKIVLQDLFDGIQGLDEYVDTPWYKRRPGKLREWLDCVVWNSMDLQDEIVKELNAEVAGQETEET